MQLGREDVYGNVMDILRFNPKEENARFIMSDEGLTVGEGAVHIHGDCDAPLSEYHGNTSVFGLKEDGTPIICSLDEAEYEVPYILKGSPRIVHKGELKINTVNEKTDINDVFSERPRLGVGYNNEGDVIVAALESAITVKQLGQLMLELGCVEAINVYGSSVGKIEYKGISVEKITGDAITPYGDEAGTITAGTIDAKDLKKPTNTKRKNKKK